MGRTIEAITVSNYADILEVEAGRKQPQDIRRIVIQGVIDTGATRLVLPASVVEYLGLPVQEQCEVRYADHRRVMRDMVRNAYVELHNRGGVFKAIVEPARTDALVGAIVMEDLDLLVDCSAQRTMPRNPTTLVTEIE